MFEIKINTGKKSAEVSVELSLSIIMSVAVLFIGLGLFSKNLENIAIASGMKNLFNSEKAVKTFDDDAKLYAGNNPTKTQINVQLVADQGLNYYLSGAQATIKKYKATPPENQSQTEDLARAATIAKIFDILEPADETTFYKDYSINIQDTKGYVKAGDKKLPYNYRATDLGSDSGKITLAKDIMDVNNQFR